MNNLSAKIKELDEAEFSVDLHNKIVNKAKRLRMRPFIAIIGLLLVSNLVLSGWHILVKIEGIELVILAKVFLADFSLNYGFLSDFAETVVDFMSLTSILVFLSNFLVGSYMVSFLVRERSSQRI